MKPFDIHQVVHDRQGECWQVIAYMGQDRWLVTNLQNRKLASVRHASELKPGVLMETIVMGTQGQTRGIYVRHTTRARPQDD